MYEAAIIVLLVAWLLGLFSSYTLGGAIHVLLATALVLAMVRLTRRRTGDKRRIV